MPLRYRTDLCDTMMSATVGPNCGPAAPQSYQLATLAAFEEVGTYLGNHCGQFPVAATANDLLNLCHALQYMLHLAVLPSGEPTTAAVPTVAPPVPPTGSRNSRCGRKRRLNRLLALTASVATAATTATITDDGLKSVAVKAAKSEKLLNALAAPTCSTTPSATAAGSVCDASTTDNEGLSSVLDDGTSTATSAAPLKKIIWVTGTD